jgi:hypothetical protein
MSSLSTYNWTDFWRTEGVIQGITNQNIYKKVFTGIPYDARKLKIINVQYDALNNFTNMAALYIPSLNLSIPFSVVAGSGNMVTPVTLLLNSPFPVPFEFQLFAYNSSTIDPTIDVTGILSFTFEIIRDEDSRRLCHGIRNTPN